MYACANGVLLSLTLEAAAKASHAPGNVKGTNLPRMTSAERASKAGTCVYVLSFIVCDSTLFHPPAAARWGKAWTGAH